jgi:hypothetical protein
MCSQLFQIYQKRTPTFLAEVVVLVASGILLLKTNEMDMCALQPTLHGFYLLVFALAVAELMLKLLVFAVIYCKNR